MADPGTISWFRRPAPTRDDPYAGGTLNAAFQLLDRTVVRGAGDRTLLSDESGELSHATVLEMAAAFGGVLRGFGVVPGDRVVVELAAAREAVVALLATARIGAAGVTIPQGLDEAQTIRIVGATRPRVVVTADDAAMAAVLGQCAHRPGAVVTTGVAAPASHSVTWDVVIRAGRTDPARAVELEAGSPSVLIWPADPTSSEVRLRTTLEQAQIARDLADAAPLTTSRLVAALFD